MTSIESLSPSGARPVTVEPAMIWIDGEPRRANDALVSALDRGLTLADGLFETMLLHRGSIFRLDPHLDRLRDGCRRLRIPLPDVGAMLHSAVRDAADAGRLEGSVRVTVTRGVGAAGVAPPGAPTPTVVVSISAPPADTASARRSLSVRLASGRRNEHAVTAGLKTLSYTDSVLALLEARQAGADDALFLDTAGHLAEATSSNLFVVARGTLLTPPLSCGVLPGITRAAVLECALLLGIEVSERELPADQLRTAEEAFLTSSVRGLMPVAIFEERPLAAEVPGPVTRRLMAGYAELIREECSP